MCLCAFVFVVNYGRPPVYKQGVAYKPINLGRQAYMFLNGAGLSVKRVPVHIPLPSFLMGVRSATWVQEKGGVRTYKPWCYEGRNLEEIRGAPGV